MIRLWYIIYNTVWSLYRLDYGSVSTIAAVALLCTNKTYNYYSFVVILLRINTIWYKSVQYNSLCPLESGQGTLCLANVWQIWVLKWSFLHWPKCSGIVHSVRALYNNARISYFARNIYNIKYLRTHNSLPIWNTWTNVPKYTIKFT